MEGEKIAIILVIVLGVVSVAAIIIASVSISRPMQPTVKVEGNKIGSGSSGTGSGIPRPGMMTPQQVLSETSNYPGKIWSIAVGHDWGAHEYIDSKGYLAGFTHELIAEVCNAAKMNCRTIWEPYTNCWISKKGEHPRLGVGLASRWYDACTGWAVSVARIQSCAFSMPFLKQVPAYFWTKEGDNSFNANDITGKKIGFLDGWVSDEKCLARQTSIRKTNDGSDQLPVNQIFHFKTREELVKAITDEKVHAGFNTEVALKNFPGIQKNGAGYMCAVSGNSMMTMKDNSFSRYWNEGFQKLLSNGAFKKMCEDANKRHNEDKQRGQIVCVDS